MAAAAETAIAFKAVGHRLCPFVQRMAIALRSAAYEYEIEYVDLDRLPAWLLKIAPLARVPVLLANGQTLYESLVILEFINDLRSGRLHPEDTLERARQRSLMAFASEALALNWRWSMSRSQDEFDRLGQRLRDYLRYAESQIEAHPYFNGDQLTLIDIAFAPLLQRLGYIERDSSLDPFGDCPKLRDWAHSLCSHSAVTGSAPAELDRLLAADMRKQESLLASKLVDAS